MDSLDLRLDRLPPRVVRACRREMAALPDYLRDDEMAEDAVVGWMAGGPGALVRTDQRVLFIGDGPVSGRRFVGIDLGDVLAVTARPGLLIGRVVIASEADDLVVEQVRPRRVRAFTDGLREACPEAASGEASDPETTVEVTPVELRRASFRLPSTSPVPRPSPRRADWISDLERLARLRAVGALTDDEFQTQKRRILAERG